MATVHVTYEVITEESAQDGDYADHGWMRPETRTRLAEQRSLRKGGRRMYERNVRMSRKGAFDWPSLRAALEWINDNTSAYYEGQEDWTMDPAVPGKRAATLSVRAIQGGDDVVMGRNGYEYDTSRTNYTLHVSGVSHGTIDRLKRHLKAQGVRFY